MRIDFSELRLALDFVSFGAPLEHSAYICRKTGRFFWHSEYGDNEEELPDDIDDGTAYIALPDKRDLDLGSRLALRFASDCVPELYGKVRDLFNHRGAYARFKDLLEEHQVLRQWYDYEEQATNAALRRWCTEEGIEIED